jgi:hypothetical protein
MPRHRPPLLANRERESSRRQDDFDTPAGQLDTSQIGGAPGLDAAAGAAGGAGRARLAGPQHVMGSKGNNARLSLFRYQTGLGERRTHGDTDETAHPFDRWNSNVDVG